MTWESFISFQDVFCLVITHISGYDTQKQVSPMDPLGHVCCKLKKAKNGQTSTQAIFHVADNI